MTRARGSFHGFPLSKNRVSGSQRRSHSRWRGGSTNSDIRPPEYGGRDAGGSGGARRGFTAQNVNRILVDPIYIGKITHRLRVSGNARATSDGALRELKVYDGTHTPIVDLKTWQRVRERMDREQTQARQRWTHTHLLKGKLRTFEGFAMSPGSVQRPASKRRGQQHNVQNPPERRRVRYYMSQKAIKQGYAACPVKNVNATYIDDLVRALVIKYLAQHESIDFGGVNAMERDSGLREVIRSVVVAPEWVRIELDSNSMVEQRSAIGARELHKTNGGACMSSLPVCLIEPEVEAGTLGPVLTIHMQIKRHDGKRLMLGPNGQDLLSFAKTDGSPVPREHIVRAIGQAFAWREELLRTGGRINDLARAYGYTDSRFHRLLELTNLAPDVIRSALSGEMSGMVSLGDLLETAGHLDWNAQRKRTAAPR